MLCLTQCILTFFWRLADMVNIPKVISDQVSGKNGRPSIVMFSGLFELAFGYKWFAVKDSNPYPLEHQPSYATTRLRSFIRHC
jgi:hypothetical protein